MPGGQKEAYELVCADLTKIAAVAEDGSHALPMWCRWRRPLCEDGSQRY